MINRHPRLWWAALIASPLVLAAIWLAWKPWAPTLDMAMTELRVRDVGTTQTPLIGLPGRIGNFPDQGSHPGPWSFYLVAPFYWVSGRRAWGLEFASAMLNAVALGVAVWLGHRLHRAKGVVLVAAIGAVAVRGYGLSVLTHPWNPYFPVLTPGRKPTSAAIPASPARCMATRSSSNITARASSWSGATSWPTRLSIAAAYAQAWPIVVSPAIVSAHGASERASRSSSRDSTPRCW